MSSRSSSASSWSWVASSKRVWLYCSKRSHSLSDKNGAESGPRASSFTKTTISCSFWNARSIKSKADSDRKSTRLNSSHVSISYAVFCLKKKTKHKRGGYLRNGCAARPGYVRDTSTPPARRSQRLRPHTLDQRTARIGTHTGYLGGASLH